MATTKQKKAIKKVLNGTPIKHAMQEVGYAPSTAKTTTKLTSSKAWEELMEKNLPDKLLAKKHLALLEKEEVVVRNNVTSGEIETIPTGQIDTTSVAKGLDMAYKLKKRYPKESEINQQFNIAVKEAKITFQKMNES